MIFLNFIGTFRDQVIYPDSYSDMCEKGLTDEHLVECLKIVIHKNYLIFPYYKNIILGAIRIFIGERIMEFSPRLARCFKWR